MLIVVEEPKPDVTFGSLKSGDLFVFASESAHASKVRIRTDIGYTMLLSGTHVGAISSSLYNEAVKVLEGRLEVSFK